MRCKTTATTSNLTAAQIGQTWLNYLIEKRTILWWGGMGNSTEHTAFMRLKHGYPAPAERLHRAQRQGRGRTDRRADLHRRLGHGRTRRPEFAADLARRAGSVSHDGEAIYGAQVLAAMESQAFVESDIDKLIDTGLSVIPNDCIIYRMINEIREWHAAKPDDWQRHP